MSFKELLNAITQGLVVACIAWLTWVTVEQFQNQIAHATMLTVDDVGEKVEAAGTNADKLERLIQDVQSLHDKMDAQREQMATVKADLEHVKNALD
jgi:ABC-type phosphate transport system auxiliary subunit